MPIRPELPQAAEIGVPMAATLECAATLELLSVRRSTPLAAISEPGPLPADIDQLLRLAMRVPDHRKLEPWRFIVFEGEGREKLGNMFAAALMAGDFNTPAEKLAEARAMALRAPVIVAVVSSPVRDPKATPIWEQELSAGAVCQNLLLAAFASGWAATWITEWPAFDGHVAHALGLRGAERVAGFIYIGTAKDQPVERQRPDPAAKVLRWS